MQNDIDEITVGPVPSMSNSALIGSTGFVGTTLASQAEFGAFFRSGNIGDIAGRHFDQIVCAAAPAQKWIANRDPESDRKNIQGLIANLKTVSCDNFILISTVDVFSMPIGVDESTPVNQDGLHAYGLNRLFLEKFVESHFTNHLIVRLPGLVGPGLRKNVIFDFLNDNNLDLIDSRGLFQFYPMVNLWYDVQVALRHGLTLVHLTAEPILVADVARLAFNRMFDRKSTSSPAKYDMRTHYAALFGCTGDYQYSRRETLQAIRAYVQSEPRVKAAGEGAGR
jgi:nucleoside-diphosphate-sugar epimerase